MNKKGKICVESIEGSLNEIRKAKETNKSVLLIRKITLAYKNGYLTESEFGNQICEIVLSNSDFKTLSLLEKCEHALIIAKEIIEEK